MTTILIINSAEKGIIEYVEPIQKIAAQAGATSEVIEYEDSLNTNMSLYDGIIMSGSPRGDDIVDHHLPYFQWIKTCEIPIFGICAGHHITGKLYGAQLIRSVEKEVGDNFLFIRQKDPIYNGCPERFLVRQNHHDSITLPKDFILLAHSQGCRVSMMKHPAKLLYTTQFHPEILNKNLILNFIDIVKNHKKSAVNRGGGTPDL
jgi:GMP synthase (glutamine-hydrolysing)